MAQLFDFPFNLPPHSSNMVSPLTLGSFLEDALACLPAVLEAIVKETKDGLVEKEVGQGRVIDEKDRFGVEMFVDQFKPEELTIRVADNHLVIEGKHEERDDNNGFASRNFSRRFPIPENVEQDKLQSRLVNGVLKIEAPKKPEIEEKPKEVPIPITFEK